MATTFQGHIKEMVAQKERDFNKKYIKETPKSTYTAMNKENIHVNKSFEKRRSDSSSKYDEIISKEQQRNQDLLSEIRKLKKYNEALFK